MSLKILFRKAFVGDFTRNFALFAENRASIKCLKQKCVVVRERESFIWPSIVLQTAVMDLCVSFLNNRVPF